MNEWQRNVMAFHQKFGRTIGDPKKPSIKDVELRCRLIREESGEAVQAIERGDLVEAIDGICDAIFVLAGSAVTFGIDLEPFYDEVQQTNMAKMGGPIDGMGKVMKPPDWEPPKLECILQALREGVSLKRDGDGWCATGPGFVGTERPLTGFGKKPSDAIFHLKVQEDE
jgi:predicted HAD superfamily Cof-like phosphohydrolase